MSACIVALLLTLPLVPVLPILTPGSEADAAGICDTSFCASIQIVNMHGTGYGRVTSDPAGIDCSVDPSGFSGTCFYTFAWSKLISSIYVDISVTASFNSYVCMGMCTGLGGSIGTSVALSPGDAATLSPKFDEGKMATFYVDPDKTSTGAGTVTTSPAGINCRIVAGVGSGTCSHDFWFLGSSLDLEETVNPDNGSYGCVAGECGAPDTDFKGSFGLGPGPATFSAAFWTTYLVTATVSGSGTLVSSPGGISCPTACSHWFEPYSTVTLTASPAPGWKIQDWGGGCNNLPVTSTVCQLATARLGGAASIAFASLTAPTPTPSPGPTASPRPSAAPPSTTSPGATPVPRSSQLSGGGGTAAPGNSPVPTDGAPTSEASTAAAGSGPPSPSLVAGDVAVGNGQPERTSAPAAGSAGGQSQGPDPAVVIVVALLIIAGLGLGWAVGRRGRRSPTGSSPG
ncbi:MAG: hypothetical protein HYX55_05810 [Chloroflexi bacterium]|nr:hypothetical protein [Chloroflexota bacterium]